MYSSYGRTGGCASCGVAPRDISSTQYSNNYYSNYNRYESNNNYVNKYSLDNNRFENSYSNGLRKRIMTPTKNYTSSHLNTDHTILLKELQVAENALLIQLNKEIEIIKDLLVEIILIDII